MTNTVQFNALFKEPLRNGVSYASRLRGTGVPMINMKEIFAFDRIVDADFELVPLTDSQLDKYLVDDLDLLFARQSLSYEGAGKCSIVLPASRPRTWEGHLIRVRIDRDVANPAFYFYYFQSPQGRRNIETIVEQVAAAGIRGSDLARLQVPFPPLRDQSAIAEVLGALDDKIAVNSRLAHTADGLQRTTFQSLLADAVQVPLSETAQFVNGKAFTMNASGSGRMVVRIAELNSGPGASTVYNDLEVDEKHLARPGDILFAWSGSLTLHRWSRDEAIVNQHIFKVIANPDYPPWLVFELIRHKLEEFRAVAADKATTMGHIQRRHLDEPVLVPLQAAVASCDPLMAGLWDRALKANEENLALASLRDTLLPQLMSGKLRVRDAEQVVEDVV